MADNQPMPMIGRQKIVHQVIERLVRPDDWQSDPRGFIRPGFYGLGGVGKSRLLAEIAREALKVTPYVVMIDLDPRNNPPATPVQLAGRLIEKLDAQDKVRRPFLRKGQSPFKECLQVIREIHLTPVVQTIEAKDSQLTNVTQTTGSAMPDSLSQSFAIALGRLSMKGETQRKFGFVGKGRSRPLVLLLLDTVDLVARPIRDWLPNIESLFTGNVSQFYALSVLAGRQAEPPWLETALPPLSAGESREFIQEYVGYRREHDWFGLPWKGLELVRSGPLVDAIVELGDGVPLLLQWLIEIGAIDTRAFVTALDWPSGHEARLRYAIQVYLRRLQLFAKDDERMWQAYYLMLYGAVPRRVVTVGMLQALLQDLPGTKFDKRTLYQPLYQQLAREAFARQDKDGSLLYHGLVREGTLDYLRANDGDQWKRLNERAAGWYETHGDVTERYYHRFAAHYDETMAEVKSQIASALAAKDWPRAQALLATTGGADPTPDDKAWLTLFKAGLAWGEGNQALALERLRTLYGDSTPRDVQNQVVTYLEQWLGFSSLMEEKSQSNVLKSRPISNAFDALWWARMQGLTVIEAKLCIILGAAARLQYRNDEAEGYYRQALNLCRAVAHRLGEAHALHGLGDGALAQNHYNEAIGYQRQALELYKALAYQLGEAHTLHGLGDIARVQDRYNEAVDYYGQALDLYKAVDDQTGQADALQGLGGVARLQNRDDEAASYHRHALDLYKAVADKRGQADAIHGLGEVARVQNRNDDAVGYYRQALDLCRAVAHRLGEAHALHGLGDGAYMQGRYDESASYYRQALDVCRAINRRRGQANALSGLGDVARVQNRNDEALNYLRQALELSKVIDDRLGQASALRGLGNIACVQKRYDEAVDYLRQALEISKVISDRPGQANVLSELGDVARSQDRNDEATGYYQQALELHDAIDNRLGRAHTMARLGLMAIGEGHIDDALRHYSATFALYSSIGMPALVTQSSLVVRQG
jgi:tetratricopeptide (TPR) repeat protein